MIIKIYNYQFQTILEVAEYYNVDKTCINQLLLGRTWKHVTGQLSVPLANIKLIISKPDNVGVHYGQSKFSSSNKIRKIKIRLKNGERPTNIARSLGLHPKTISDIKVGKTYAHITI